jgi:glycosyltransferase involved in cell wall biosynthesis
MSFAAAILPKWSRTPSLGGDVHRLYPPHGDRPVKRIWIDVEDLFVFARFEGRLSGIQRLEYELYRELRAAPQSKGRIFFVRHDKPRRSLTAVPWESVEAICDVLANGSQTSRPPSRVREVAKSVISALPAGLRIVVLQQVRLLLRLTGIVRSQMAGIIGLLRFHARFWSSRQGGEAGPSEPRNDDFARLAQPGDILAVFGGAWITSDYMTCLESALHERRLRLALLVYDLIPARRPEWFNEHIVEVFRSWIQKALPLADTILTISAATAQDVEAYARRTGLTLCAVPTPIPIGTGFKKIELSRQPGPGARSSRLPAPDSYALFVSTLEVRKNHTLLFRVWRQLLDEMPSESVPTLVFAGRVGWLVSDLMAQLHNSRFLGGKIIHVETPSDEELAALYDGCLFTLFPSLYEGWGLPVTESHAFGRPCIVSKATSLPEAGGALARYFDPENVADAYRVIRDTIEDPAGLRRWRDRVRREFRPVDWSESARAVLHALDGEAVSNLDAAKLRWSA